MYKRHIAILSALTPVAHGDTHSGIDNRTNTRLFMRQGTLYNGRCVLTPHVSENALRSVMVRRPLADGLARALGFGEDLKMPRAVMNLLYAGGSMGGEKAPSDEISLGHAIRKLYPSIELLGGAVNSFILPPGRLRVSAWLVAEEYANAIKYVAPSLYQDALNVSAHDLITPEVRTRGTGAEAEGNQMIYEYEVLAAGAKVVVEFTLDAHASEAAQGALASAIEQWDGFIGGQGRQGRGRMVIDGHDLPPPEPYLAHLAENAEKMRDGLSSGTLGAEKILCHG